MRHLGDVCGDVEGIWEGSAGYRVSVADPVGGGDCTQPLFLNLPYLFLPGVAPHVLGVSDCFQSL